MSVRLLFLLMLLSLTACASPLKETFDSGDEGAFRFRMTVPDIQFPEYVQGRLILPDNTSEPVPLVVLVHGTSGVGYRENTWADFLSDKGYAVFVLDYFAPRGVSGQSRRVPRPPEDIWSTLNALMAHPDIDITRAVIMGFSNGASVTALSSAVDPEFGELNAPLPLGYIQFYGGCHTPLRTYTRSYRPAYLFVVGDSDNLVPKDDCLERSKDFTGEEVEVVVIDGAGHMFDGNKNTTFIHPRWGRVELSASREATEKSRQKVSLFLERLFDKTTLD